ncbi:Carbonic anhydrase-related protein 10 [Eufriesea mexicana]|nr:Carbonic anhydrase-related protein 10 [Eufriesea mexicana]
MAGFSSELEGQLRRVGDAHASTRWRVQPWEGVEIQVYGFNAELYHNLSEAQHKSQGLVAISLMVQLGETVNPELQIITSVFNKVLYRGDAERIRHLSLKSLLPDTNGYMTYEGSTTHPGCWETAVWLILNKPIYITARELYALRKLMQGPMSTPKAPLGNNSRPLQDLHYRTIRTNIDFRKVNCSLLFSSSSCQFFLGRTRLADEKPWLETRATEFDRVVAHGFARDSKEE